MPVFKQGQCCHPTPMRRHWCLVCCCPVGTMSYHSGDERRLPVRRNRVMSRFMVDTKTDPVQGFLPPLPVETDSYYIRRSTASRSHFNHATFSCPATQISPLSLWDYVDVTENLLPRDYLIERRFTTSETPPAILYLPTSGFLHGLHFLDSSVSNIFYRMSAKLTQPPTSYYYGNSTSY